jgi:hypothetical protein
MAGTRDALIKFSCPNRVTYRCKPGQPAALCRGRYPARMCPVARSMFNGTFLRPALLIERYQFDREVEFQLG